jgi:hypothetical protein
MNAKRGYITQFQMVVVWITLGIILMLGMIICIEIQHGLGFGNQLHLFETNRNTVPVSAVP